MGLLFIFIILLILSFFLSVRLKKEMADTIFLSLSLLVLLLFILGVFGLLRYSVIIVLLITMVLLGYDIYYIIKDKKVIKNLFTPAAFYMLFIFMVTYFVYNESYIKEWDEFSHWGLYVKNIFLNDSLWNNNFTSVPNGYPPIISTFQYFLMRLANSYNEAYLFEGLSLLTLLPFCFFFKYIKKKYLILLLSFFIFFLPQPFSYFYINTTYTDIVIGMMYGAIILSMIIEEVSVFNLAKNMIIASVLILAKEFGIVLVCIYFFLLFIDFLFIRKKDYQKLDKKIFLLPLLPIIFRGVWYIFVRNLNFVSQMSATLDLSNKNDFGKLFNVFINAITNDRVGSLNRSINIQIVYWLVIILLFVFITYVYLKNRSDNKLLKLLSLSIIASFILYSCGLFMSYLSLFNDVESYGLASFVRYMFTIFIALLLVTFLVIVYLLVKDKLKESPLPMLLIVIMLVIFVPSTFFRTIKNLKYNPELKNYHYYKYRKYIDAKDEISGRIYFVSCKSDGRDYWTFRYLATPSKISDDDYNVNYTKEEWKNILKDYDYVYLQRITEDFVNKFSDLFIKIDDLYAPNIYKIVKENNDIKLKLIGEE